MSASAATSTDTRWWAGLALLLLLVSATLVALQIPAPRGDDAAYKSPAAEWAETGRLAVPGLTGLLNTADQGFAHYPPLYPLTYGAWYRVWGFSLRSTLACSYLIHLLQTGLVAAACQRLLQRRESISPAVRRALVASAALVTFGNCAYFDRPEELGLCYVWVGFLAWNCADTQPGYRAYSIWGILLGLAALTAPFAGLLGAWLVVARGCGDLVGSPSAARRRMLGAVAIRVGLAAGVSMALVGGWAAWMETRAPGILRDQLLQGNLAFASLARDQSWLARLAQFPRSLLFAPPQLPAALLGLWLLPVAWSQRELRDPPAIALWCSVVGGLAVVALIRPSAYTYSGAALMLVVPLFALGVSRFVLTPATGLQRMAWCAIGVCVLVSGRDVAWSLVDQVRLPAAETANGSADLLHRLVPPGELVAVAPRHWYAFQGRNPWRDAFLAALRDDQEIRRCQWLVLYPGIGSPPYLKYFEPVADSTVSAQRDHTYAFTVWQRRPEPSDDQQAAAR